MLTRRRHKRKPPYAHDPDDRHHSAPPPAVLCPLGRWGWDQDAVAAHLLGCQARIVGGLTRRSPWVGIDQTTLAELFLAAAEFVSREAAQGNRYGWQRREHLERAVIAAFRHAALKHWRTVNSLKRRGDRDAVELTIAVHEVAADASPQVAQDPTCDEAVARDWLAQLRGAVRDFWQPVLLDGSSLLEAGRRLGLSRGEGLVLWREGIEQLRRFRSLHEAGLVCRLRTTAIAAMREGVRDPVQVERARAHLAYCGPCRRAHGSGELNAALTD